MPGQTSRGYPFPLDTDLIDTAGDMQRLAEGVNTDTAAIDARVATNAAEISRVEDWSNARDNVQDAAIGQNSQDIEEGRDRLTAVNQYLYYTLLKPIAMEQKLLAGTVGITTDALGYGSYFWAPDTFQQNSGTVVLVGPSNHANGNTLMWLDGAVAGSNWQGFGSQWVARNTANVQANASIVINFFAAGVRDVPLAP